MTRRAAPTGSGPVFAHGAGQGWFESAPCRMTTPRYRSKLEARLAAGPLAPCAYETVTVLYPRPRGAYTVDFITPSGRWIEVKGFFTSADRTKMRAVKAAHPERDIRLVFQTPHKTLSKRSDTTYAQWAERHGFPWCDAKDTLTLERWARE